MRKVLFCLVQLMLLFFSTLLLADSKSPGGDVAACTTQQLRGIVAVQSQLTEKERIAQLVRSIDAISAKGYRFSQRYKERIARAALAAEKATGVDATLMIAVARVESDFRGLTQVSPRCLMPGVQSCHADCGITQHYISGSRRWVIKRCNKLAKNYHLAFLKSAKELARHIKWCKAHPKYHQPLRRCILNRYNSGTFYKTWRRCKRRWKRIKIQRNETYVEFVERRRRWQRGRRRCYGRAAYWKKVLCFDFGARNFIRAKHSCRRCHKLNQIATRFYPPPRTTVPAKSPTASTK
jgi:hypothetical protein